jgi:hypothetical protein
MNLADALPGRAKLEGVRWMVRDGAPRRALRSKLSSLLPASARLGPCRLRYARFGPGCRLTAYYDARVSLEGTKGYGVRPVAVTWRPDGDIHRYHGAADLAEIQAEAVRRSVAAPFRQLTADLPEWSMHLQVSPLDGHFPQLVRWSDPRYARDVIAGACAAREVAHDHVPAGQYAVTLVRYRPAKRHVLRYDSQDTPDGGTVYAKLYPSEKGERIHRVATRVAEWLEDHREGMTSVRPLAYVAEDAVVLYPRAVGTPLCDQLRRPGRHLARCLDRAGAALRALHHLPLAVAGPLHVHDFASVIREVARDSAHVHALVPKVGVALGALLDRAGELHERLPQEPPTFTHRDFKCEHLLVAAGGLTLIDFDRCALADPAYDIGKFLADLQWWFTTYDQDRLEQAHEHFLAGYALRAREERLLRARLYEAVQLVQMAVLRARLFEHDAAYRIERLIGRAQSVMDSLPRAFGWTGSLGNRTRSGAVSG